MDKAAVTLALLIALAHVHRGAAQGLLDDSTAALKARSVTDSLKAIYSKSQAFKRAFKSRTMATTCSKTAGSLCSPYGPTREQRAILLMAASPQVFDARSAGSMGSFSAVAQPKDQGSCNSCVAFAILAAAQSAMACALKEEASSRCDKRDCQHGKFCIAQQGPSCAS